MSSVFDIVRDAMESSFTATTDIYGQGTGNYRDNLVEAISGQMNAIAEQEESFEALKQQGLTTPLTDKLEGVVAQEKARVTPVLSRLKEG